MSIYRHEDPDRDVDAYLENKSKLIYPVCQICNDEIYEARCYVMNDFDEFNNCICQVCGRHELFKAIKSLDTAFTQYLEDYLNDRLVFTPTEERDI